MESQAYAAAVDRNDKILLAGIYTHPVKFPDACYIARLNDDGSLDESFSENDGDGIDGVKIITTAEQPSYPDWFSDVYALPDGDILACGVACSLDYPCFYMTLARFNEDGSLDEAFAAVDDGIEDIEGVYSLAIGEGDDMPRKILVDDQGRILLIGSSESAWEQNTEDLVVVRFTPDGEPDASFGQGDGIALYEISGLEMQDGGEDAVLMPDGRIIISGFAEIDELDYYCMAARIDDTGALDTTFGGGAGYTITSEEGKGYGVMLQPDGKIAVACDLSKVMRFTEDGELDPDFGINGVMDYQGDYTMRDIRILPDSKILVSGEGHIIRLLNTDLGEPEIDIQRPEGVSIPDGGTDDLGTMSAGPVNLVYTVDNSAGYDRLSVTDLIASELNNIGDVSFHAETPFVLDWGETGAFDVSFVIEGEGSFGFNMEIVNNDGDEGAYDITVAGAVPTSIPTPSATPTAVPSSTPTDTPTNTPTDTPSLTPTRTPTFIPTRTPTLSPTDTPTDFPTSTSSPTLTSAPTETPTYSPSPSQTITSTYTPTSAPTNTPTDTPSAIPTRTPTNSPTRTATLTATPTIYNTLTPVPSYSPTRIPNISPTATHVCNTTGVTLWMPAHEFHEGDPCCCIMTVCNAEGYTLTGYPLWLILDVYGEYFFGPSFTGIPDNYLALYPQFEPGETFIEALGEFEWPAGAGSASGIVWWAAITDQQVTSLFGQLDSWEFGWN